MPNVTTTTQIPSAVSEFYDRLLLERALPLLVHDKFGQRRPLPKNNSDTIKFRRYNALTPNTTPLTEGTTPNGQQLSKTDITATIAEYGDYVTITDKVSLVNVEPVLTEAAELLGEQAGQSLDIIYRDVLVAGTNVIYSNGAARTAINTLISAAILDKAIVTLNAANAKPFTSVIAGTDRHNTTPIPAAFWAIVHPHLWKDLKDIPGWIPVQKYPKPESAIDGEIGAYENIRFVSSTQAKYWPDAGANKVSGHRSTSGSKEDVYCILILGQNAYGITDLQGEGLKFIVKPFGSAGSADPLDQRATSGWKAWTTAKILNDSFMLRIECACSE